jgi:hypothetical protein
VAPDLLHKHASKQLPSLVGTTKEDIFIGTDRATLKIRPTFKLALQKSDGSVVDFELCTEHHWLEACKAKPTTVE